MFKKPKTKTASFSAYGEEYKCMISYYGAHAVAPYKLIVHAGYKTLILDSNFVRIQEATELDIFFDFDEIVKTEQFRDMVINSDWWNFED